MYFRGSRMAFFAKQATEVQDREQAIFKWFGSFAEVPGKALKSLVYPGTLLESASGDFLPFVHSTFESKGPLKEEGSRTL